MRIRFGYVAMALDIIEGSPNKTVTVANLLKVPQEADRLNRLRRLVKKNLENQLRVLKYNKAHEIEVFRVTSKLIPLATHPATAGWDYLSEFHNELDEIGGYAKDNNMRLSAHPDHFVLLNSPKAEVISASLKDLEYHADLLDAMGLNDSAKLVLHVGGLYKDKEPALVRFKDNFKLLPAKIRNRIIIENDDRSYSAADVLKLCKELNAPMVLDVHHHYCCNNGEPLIDLLPDIFDTWQVMQPKLHFSSPKDAKNFRAHADCVNVDDLLNFLRIAKDCVNRDFDIMLEAKQKDRALHALMQQLKGIQGIKIVGQAAIEY